VATGPGPAVGLHRAGDGAAGERREGVPRPGPGRRPRGRDDHRLDVAVGDDVELNQTLCTVETNKAEVEIPSPYAGRIVELGGAEGETLTVGSVLVRIATSVAETAGAAEEPVAPPPSANGSARKPVLVGYGADEDMDTSRRGSVGDARGPSRRCESWPPS
jgi:Pyruvate/2-oxoglutarate dehydrogenase complex, dihydrolipoamide acyltransferase (E2) component, and related enzymes